MDRLVGPYPAMAERYRQRSPVHYLDEIAAPCWSSRGADDRVVPPTQAEAIVAALQANRIPHAYLRSRARATVSAARRPSGRAQEAELSFLGQVFGFEPADTIEPLALDGLDEWRARRSRATAARR